MTFQLYFPSQQEVATSEDANVWVYLEQGVGTWVYDTLPLVNTLFAFSFHIPLSKCCPKYYNKILNYNAHKPSF
jgi:hypothetical protein